MLKTLILWLSLTDAHSKNKENISINSCRILKLRKKEPS